MPRRKRDVPNGEHPETAPATAGHNSATMSQAISEGFERWKALCEQKAEIGEAQADIINGLKETYGLSKKAIRRAWADAMMEGAEASTMRSDYETVMAALGQLAGTPLGDAAVAAAEA